MPQPLPLACELLESHNSVTISVSPAPNMMLRHSGKGRKEKKAAEEGVKKLGREGV